MHTVSFEVKDAERLQVQTNADLLQFEMVTTAEQMPVGQIAAPDGVPMLMPVKHICRHFGLSKSTLYRWKRAKLIEGIHVGRSYLVFVDSVDAMINSLRQH